ncbi:hypothetical protein CDAR_125281 [Caerostris darwini]|uniref:Uncharacterized protein n=1 Tax=Caerostris darwini TaxID=1538125 RepID=A0AAV4Q327_9ARAC|nr:hypothetical protein CDAR_125281 [Caerostris darwini]
MSLDHLIVSETQSSLKRDIEGNFLTNESFSGSYAPIMKGTAIVEPYDCFISSTRCSRFLSLESSKLEGLFTNGMVTSTIKTSLICLNTRSDRLPLDPNL